jgi:hypothetical protein
MSRCAVAGDCEGIWTTHALFSPLANARACLALAIIRCPAVGFFLIMVPFSFGKRQQWRQLQFTIGSFPKAREISGYVSSYCPCADAFSSVVGRALRVLLRLESVLSSVTPVTNHRKPLPGFMDS